MGRRNPQSSLMLTMSDIQGPQQTHTFHVSSPSRSSSYRMHGALQEYGLRIISFSLERKKMRHKLLALGISSSTTLQAPQSSHVPTQPFTHNNHGRPLPQ